MVAESLVAERTALGDAILRLRKRADLTQFELARSAGVERSYISMLEHGERKNASSTVLLALARALGVTTADLYREAELHWPEVEGPDAASIVVAQDAEQASILRRLAQFSTEHLVKLERTGRIIFLEAVPPKHVAGGEEDQPADQQHGPDDAQPDPQLPA